MEFTAYPESRMMVDRRSSGAPIMEVEPSIENTAGFAEVQIRDLDAICKSRAANPFVGVGIAQVLGITVLYSTTVTVNVTSTSVTTSVAQINTFTIAGCAPSPLPFDTC